MFNKTRLLTPGPTPLPEPVRLALARDMIHHRKDEFETIMQNLQPRLQNLFGCTTPVLPLSSSGTGAMCAAVFSLFAPGEKVLVVEGGKFGQRWSEIAASCNLQQTIIHVPWGEAVAASDVAKHLQADPSIRGVLVQLCETSTGVLHPVQEIASLTSKNDILLVVDGISAVGISPCPMLQWKIDCLLTGSQKGLLLPPGLSLIALSDRAWEKAKRINSRSYYFNLPAELDKLKKGQTHFTTPVNLIMGLEASMDVLLKNGLDAIYAKQWALTMLVRAGLEAMGLKLLASKNYAWGLTSVLMPETIDSPKVLKIAEEKFGVFMAGGQDSLKGKIVRFAHMGWVDWGDCLAGLSALALSMLKCGAALKKDNFLDKAMSAYQAALKEKPGVVPQNK